MTTLCPPATHAPSEERSDQHAPPSHYPSPGAPRGARLELFVCPAVGGKLTRSSCGQRHLASKRKAPKKGRNGSMDMRLYAAACESCLIGAAHSRGETPMRWPDGSAIELVAIPVRLVPDAPVERAAVAPFLAGVTGEVKPRRVEAKKAKPSRTLKPRKPRKMPGASSRLCVDCGKLTGRRANAVRCLGCAEIRKRALHREANRRWRGKDGPPKPRAKLTESDVAEIRRRRAMGETLRELGAAFGVHPNHVYRVVHGRRWKSVKT